MIQHSETYYKALHHTASHCTTLHHTATHCNTLQHTTLYIPMRHAEIFFATLYTTLKMHLTAPHCSTLHQTTYYTCFTTHSNFITRERIHVLIPDPPIISSNYIIGVHASYAHTSFINTYIMYEHLICTPVRSKGAVCGVCVCVCRCV